MKNIGDFVVDREAFAAVLSLAAAAADRGSTVPVLSHALLEAAGDRVTVAGTDLELSIRCSCAARVKMAGGAAVPVKRLYDYVRLLADGDLRVQFQENFSTVLTSTSGRMRIAGMSQESFPALPAMPDAVAEIAAATLVRLVAQTEFAISAEVSRFTVGGALLEIAGEQATMIATDGHRLAWARGAAEDVERPLRVIVPKKALTELAKLSTGAQDEDRFRIAADDNHLYFAIGDRVLTTRLLTGQFPDYTRVLPNESGHTVALHREPLKAALSRAMLFADERSRAVRVQLTAGATQIFASAVEWGEAEEVVSSAPGVDLEIGFNAGYLLDFLRSVSTEQVELRVTDGKSAGELRPMGDAGYRYVVMPMRV
jgi:DNA polymerase-3 subunit beta